MKQLSGVDASFLYMENDRSYGHVSGLGVFQRPDDPEWVPYEAMIRQISLHLPALEPLRRRLVEVPLGLDHPYWVEDPGFDLEFHVRETAIPRPGTDAQLAALVARLIARPLDRGHPLWECYVIEGLPDDRFAILTKLHHATIDGAAGAELMQLIFTGETGTAVDHPQLPRAKPVPSPSRVLGQVFTDAVRKPAGLARLQVRSLRAFGELTRNQGLTGLSELMKTLPNPVGAALTRRSRASNGDEAADVPAVPVSSAPPTPFNGSITGHRRVALRSVSLSDIQTVKRALGVSVNDVVMAVSAGALRTYLLEHDALPDQPLVAMVPVSIRTGHETDKWTNRVSAVFPAIPTDVADPLERVRRVHQWMNEAKQRFTLLPADVITEYATYAPAALFIRAARVAARFKVTDRVRLPFNLVISNVPGPRKTLELEGAEMEHYYPVSTIADGNGLNITLQSYRDIVDLALVADREMVPDLDHLADLLVDEFDALLKVV
jgi:WS/DGAT/MGAT family acyltransferase